MTLALGDHPLETAIDAAAAALFAAAVAYAASSLSSIEPILAAMIAFLPSFAILSQLDRGEQCFPLPAFEPADTDVEADELLLSTEMIAPLANDDRDELILDDVLEQLRPDSRVVRLFDPRVMPTAGELHATIDRHLRVSPSPPDASEALSEALAQLRRSLH